MASCRWVCVYDQTYMQDGVGEIESAGLRCSPTPEAALSGVQDSSQGSVDGFEINLKATGFSIL